MEFFLVYESDEYYLAVDSQTEVKMYGFRIRYLASVFVDAESIIPTAENIMGLLTAFEDKTLLPIILQEQTIGGLKPRIGFTTASRDRQVVVQGERINVEYSATDPEKSDLGDFSAFCQDAVNKLTIALNHFQRKGHRLAVVQGGYLPDLPAQEMNQIANRLFHFSPFYSKNLPFEWDWRCASLVERSFGELNEMTNTITKISRQPGKTIFQTETGEVSESPIDKIRVDFDINTSPNKITARFEEKHIASFFEQSVLWNEKISSEISSFIFGRQTNE